MTEAEWLGSTDPTVMLNYLRGSGKVNDRKLRLFAVTCCRRVWEVLDETTRAMVEREERVADGGPAPCAWELAVRWADWMAATAEEVARRRHAPGWEAAWDAERNPWVERA